MQAETLKPGPTKILEVASRLFAEKGYSNVSIRDVCKEAGTTPPMIYYYFVNKRGLFNAVVHGKVSMAEFIARLKAATKSRDEKDAIRILVGIYLTSFPEDAFDPGLYIRDTAKLDRESAERISKDLDEIYRIVTSIVEKGMEKGAFRKTDPRQAADCLIGMLNRVVFQRIHFSKGRDVEATKDFITDFFIRAMK